MNSASEAGRSAKEFAADDPLELVGVGLEEPPDDAVLDEMACSIVEEYLRVGWTGENIMRLFRNPAFHMTHNILLLKGEEYVQGLVGTGTSVLDVQEAYPNIAVDLYPFEDEPEFYPAAASGSLVMRADRTSAADILLAGSFGTLTAAEDQIVAGTGAWDDGAWSVVFSRGLQVGEEYAQFVEGDSTNAAFAVWDGAKAERDGMKSVSQFMTLEISPEIATGGGGLSGKAIMLFVIVGLVIVAGLAAVGSYVVYTRRQTA